MAVHLNLLTESLTEKFHVARSYQAHPSTTSVFSVCFGVGVYFGGYMTVYDTPTILQPTYVLASFHKKKSHRPAMIHSSSLPSLLASPGETNVPLRSLSRG